MKKVICPVLAALILLVLAACGAVSASPITSPNTSLMNTSEGDTAVLTSIATPAIESAGIGVADMAFSDTEYFRVGNLATDSVIDISQLKLLTITSDTVIPSYYEKLQELKFPAVLIKGETMEIAIPQTVDFDLFGVSTLEMLIEKAKSAISDAGGNLQGFAFQTEGSVVYGYPEKRHYATYTIDAHARDGKIYILPFKNTAFGLVIDDPWYQQGFVEYYDAEKSQLVLNGGEVNAFSPSGDTLIPAMPLNEALSIAENTRTTAYDVVIAELVYSAIPDIFADENYHLCWKITANVAYYISCETGAKWCASNSED
jgi:hypothetical protein